MKKILKISLTLLIILTFLLTACGKATTTDENDTGSTVENVKQDDMTSDDEPSSTDSTTSEEDEEGDIEVNLLDRALLESVKFNLPDTFMKVEKEISNDEEKIITTYQKGYSSRVETTEAGVTEIEIYNEKAGITYDYVLGETTGYMSKDTPDDLTSLEEEKAMEGKSLMALFEDDTFSDLILKANKEKFLGRKVIVIEMLEANPEEGAYPTSIKMWFDEKYTIDLKSVIDFGETWKATTEATEIEFNLKLDDDLFEAPKGVTFAE